MSTRFAVLLVASVVSACRTAPVRPPQPEPVAVRPRAEPPQVTRGRYLANLAGCTTCHSPRLATGEIDWSRPLAGGFETLMGTGAWRSPNITMDAATGIGTWTTEQIVDAIRNGRRPDGKELLSVMPSAFYHWMTDEDVNAVVAFMKAQPAIPNKVDPIVGIQLPPLISPAQPADHGAYIATLMHCGACHQGVNAPDIKGDTDEDIVRAMRMMTKPNHEPIKGPMVDYRAAWAQISTTDLEALLGCVRSGLPTGKPLVEDRSFGGL